MTTTSPSRGELLPPTRRSRAGGDVPWAPLLGFLALIGVSGAAVLVAGPPVGVMIVVLAIVLFALSRVDVDQVTVVIGVIAVILLLPARLRIAPLGAAGTMSSLAGSAAFALWAWGRVWGQGWLATGRQPLRTSLLLFTAAVLASDVAMGFRPHDAVESRAADRGLIMLMASAGVALLVADAVPTKERLRGVIKAIVACGACLAGLGVLQFMAGVDVPGLLKLPGFELVDIGSNLDRSGFTRIVSTTSHPIELSVVLAMLLPLALHVAFTAEARERRRWWVCAGIIGFAAPLTVSRTAVLALVVGFLVIVPGFDARRRKIVLIAGAVGIVVMRVMVPGLVGTLRSLIFAYGGDPSIATRKSDYDYVAEFVAERPFFGRGWGTFLPDRYTYLDNQLLGGLIEVGVVGVVLLIGVYATGIALAAVVRRRSTDPVERDLALCLIAPMTISLVTWMTYDAMAFPTGRTLTFLCIGCAAALWRLQRYPENSPPTTVFSAASRRRGNTEPAEG
ncbi:MAG TPA: O-antigen ligase family protein [Pseudonocardiaceae bacterium]